MMLYNMPEGVRMNDPHAPWNYDEPTWLGCWENAADEFRFYGNPRNLPESPTQAMQWCKEIADVANQCIDEIGCL